LLYCAAVICDPANLHAPRLSVIVPVRDDPQCLGICLEALRGSTFLDHEIIVVDDASTDMSAAVAEMLAARVIRLAQRCGPAPARNRGAAEARGPYLMFVDADVRVHPDTLARAVAVLDADPSVDALVGSYDAQPAAPGVVSQYKNLLDHHVHRTGRAEARTFWAACGAIRRDVFLSSGGFAEGARLRRAGCRIALHPDIQGTHLKAWTIGSVLRSDVCPRARVSGALAWTAVMALPLAMRWPLALGAAAAALAGIGALNRDLYALFARQRGLPFLLAAIPLHLLHSLNGVRGFVVGVLLDLGDRLRVRTRRDDEVAPAAPAP
jgi:hypothetical protein